MYCGEPWDRCSSGSRCSTSIEARRSRRAIAVWPGTARTAIRFGPYARRTWSRSRSGVLRRWRMSLGYDGERSDAPVLDQLETILRHVADELALWRARTVKAEAELKESSGRGGSAAKPDAETRNRVADLEQENKTLRQRVEAARGRVHDLLSRLTFLEEQAREAGGNGGVRSAAGGAAASGGGSAPGAGGGAQ